MQSDIFVIIGYQPGSDASRVPIANLKIATFDGTRLQYAGTVGTGFSDAVATALQNKLDKIRAPRSILPGLKVGGAVWVEPDMKAEIAYRGLTGSGELRAASFRGLIDTLSAPIPFPA